ncbi:MAG: transketolase-like TK C-terminal-containing protein, partial [Acidimicrobiales bacterium]
RLHPAAADARTPYISDVLGSGTEPVVAVSDYMRAVPDQVSRWVRRPFTSLGTDGFGRSDARAALRQYFEVDASNVVVAVLSSLAQQGAIQRAVVKKAIRRYGIDADAVAPFAI